MKISEVESEVGISVKAIRYYEEEGLIYPKREKNGYRVYSIIEVEQLKQIKLLRLLGVSVEEIRNIMNENQSVKQCLEQRSFTISEEINRLRDLKVLCDSLAEEKQPLMECDHYLEKINKMNGREKWFMKLKKDGEIKKGLTYFILGLLWPDMLNAFLSEETL